MGVNELPQVVRDELADLRQRNGALLEMLQSAIDHIGVPDRNCSCHVAPPCGDCVEYAHIREVIEEAEQLIATESALRSAQKARPA